MYIGIIIFIWSYIHTWHVGDYNMKVLVSSRGTILDLKKIVAKTAEKVRVAHSYLHTYIHTYIYIKGIHTIVLTMT